jgi:hypothetical protein
MKKSILKMMAALLVAGGFAFSASAQTSITGDISVDTTWTTANHPYVLENIIYVRDGATLTIDPGVVIQGVNDAFDGNPNDSDPGTLVVTRGSQIDADGTPSAPIIFTSTADQNVPTFAGPVTDTSWFEVNNKTELLGAPILLGNAYISATVTALSDQDQTTIEGITAAGINQYGGSSGDTATDNDSSGSMSYWSIRYGGEILGTSNEINGFTLGGVGSGTNISHIEVINGLDDGIELFGGSVNLKNVAIISSGDDSVDYDQGWRGKVQYLFVVQGAMTDSAGSGASDSIIEGDGTEPSDDAIPFALPTIHNATFVGLGGPNEQIAGMTKTRINDAEIDDGSGIRMFNSLFLGFTSGGVLSLEDKDNTNDPGQRAQDNQTYTGTGVAGNGTYGFLYTHSPTETGTSAPADRSVIIDEVDFWNVDAIGTSAGGDSVAEGDIPGTRANLGFNTVDQPVVAVSWVDATESGTLGYYECRSIDPRPANSATSTTITAPNDGFFDQVAYKGAFAPDSNWLAGWSLISQNGMIDLSAVAASNDITASGFGFSFDTTSGETYVIQTSSDLSSWTTIDSVTATSASTTYFDPAGLGQRLFYRVIQL